MSETDGIDLTQTTKMSKLSTTELVVESHWLFPSFPACFLPVVSVLTGLVWRHHANREVLHDL